ncbi:hypothetical protein DIPPA_19913 [Diplonema papillatum]|nr:hypothetical protein DIPPA_19913 [Diplonema papillatum]
MDGDTSKSSVEEMANRFELMNEEMFRAMDTGLVQDWADKFLSDDIHFVIAGKLNDPSEDRACVGKVAFLTWYNNVIAAVHGGSAIMEWKMLGSIQPLSSRTARYDWETLLIRGEETLRTTKQKQFTVTRDGLVSYMLTAAMTPEEDMNKELLSIRSCVPPSDCVPIRPCSHNSWDSVRSKQNSTLLSCRTCATPWKLPSGQAHRFRCVDFVHDACPHPAASCRRLHIHLKKRRLHERKHIILLKATGEATEECLLKTPNLSDEMTACHEAL